jgi:two-component system, NarL family, response regulator
MTNISVLIVDDHPFIRVALTSLLETDPRLSICGRATNGRNAIELYRALHPDVVILDLRLPDLSGAQVTRQICRQFPDAKIILFTSFAAEHEEVKAALSAGACAHVRKVADQDVLLELIHRLGGARRDVTVDVAAGP